MKKYQRAQYGLNLLLSQLIKSIKLPTQADNIFEFFFWYGKRKATCVNNNTQAVAFMCWQNSHTIAKR
jgi:hypothetical protein